jgi:hypothetical protein
VLVVAIAVLTLALRRVGFGFDRWNGALLRGVVPVRAGWLTALMSGISTVVPRLPGRPVPWVLPPLDLREGHPQDQGLTLCGAEAPHCPG